ncbi:hypothetical protein [Ensifer sp.]|jgi:hypothetical protein
MHCSKPLAVFQADAPPFRTGSEFRFESNPTIEVLGAKVLTD